MKLTIRDIATITDHAAQHGISATEAVNDYADIRQCFKSKDEFMDAVVDVELKLKEAKS